MKDSTLFLECKIFCDYLVRQNSDTYITQKYQSAHQLDVIPVSKTDLPFDRWLMMVARTHPFMTRLADSYCSVLFPNSVLRKKLVLLVAILESSKYCQDFSDMPEPSTKMTFLARCIVEGMVYVAILSLAFISLFPPHLCCILYGWMRLENKPE